MHTNNNPRISRTWFSGHSRSLHAARQIVSPSAIGAAVNSPEFVRTVVNNGPKPELKKQAIALRLKGHSYSEILKIIPVAKSTLSEWFRSVKLAKRQVHVLTEKKKAGQRKGAAAKKEKCSARRQEIYDKARSQIGDLSEREVWLICAALYWAEGGKGKSYRTSKQFDFSNTDPRMLRVIMHWLLSILKIPKDQLKFEIYIHKNEEYRVREVRQFWSVELDILIDQLTVVRYKKHNTKTNRKNVGVLYNGLVRVKVMSSSSLVRYLEGWAQGIDAFVSKVTNR